MQIASYTVSFLRSERPTIEKGKTPGQVRKVHLGA